MTWRWTKPLILLAITALGVILSFFVYDASESVEWAAVGLLVTGLLLIAFSLSWREALRAETQAAERFRAVIDNAHDAIISIDTNGQIDMFNRAAERIFGYGAEEVIGQNVNVLMPNPYHREHDGYLRNYRQTGKPKIIGTGREVEARRKDGTIFPIDLSIGEMHGRSRGFIGVIRDITDRHRSDQHVRELTAELVHISRLSAMGQLSSSLAHELNQPLTAIMSYAEAARLLLDAGGEAGLPRVKVFLGKMAEQAERAGQIIRRLRNFVEKGPVERSQEELNKVVIEASNLATTGARVDGIRVEFDLAENLPVISIDKIQIQQVIVNLVRNAVEVLRNAEIRTLTIQTIGRPMYQEVVVRDTGPGIDPTIVEKLFTPFVTTKEDGMGIGLSISQSIIEAHGGRLWAEPNPGGGAVFRMQLPETQAKDAA